MDRNKSDTTNLNNQDIVVQRGACADCKEGATFGEQVYCNYDGRFHSQHNKLPCKYFIRKQIPRLMLASKYELNK